MAKSIRSKVKRANRSLHRKAVADPIILRRQQKLAAELQKSINEKGGASIVGLRNVLNPNVIPDNVEDDNDAQEEVKEEKQTTRKVKIAALQKSTKSDSRKEMVWFK